MKITPGDVLVLLAVGTGVSVVTLLLQRLCC